jgi:hypothetical protein
MKIYWNLTNVLETFKCFGKKSIKMFIKVY